MASLGSRDETDFPLQATPFILDVFPLQTRGSQEVTASRPSRLLSSRPSTSHVSFLSLLVLHSSVIILYPSHLLPPLLSSPLPPIYPLLACPVLSFTSLYSTHLTLLSFLLTSPPFLSSCPGVLPLDA